MEEEQKFTLREQMNAYVKLGLYKKANAIAEELGVKIQIQDYKGTQYTIASDGSLRRMISKKRK